LPLSVEFSEVASRSVDKLADGFMVGLGALSEWDVLEVFHHLPPLKGIVRLRIFLPIWCGEAVTPNHGAGANRAPALRFRVCCHSIVISAGYRRCRGAIAQFGR